MSIKNIAMLVGNGLVCDFIYLKNLENDWHPSKPTMWTRQSQIQDVAPYIRDTGPLLSESNFPLFTKFVRDKRSLDPNVSDFEIFGQIIQNRYLYSETLLAEEASHFLAIAYSFFFHKIRKSQNFHDWQWVHWLDRYKARISAIVSFNYDLTLEVALAEASANFSRVGIIDEDRFAHMNSRSAFENHCAPNNLRIPVIKPHGSIDYGIANARARYPLQSSRRFMTDYTEIVFEWHLRLPRTVVDFVLPAETANISHLKWVAQGNAIWSSAVLTAQHLLLVGLSYWECDSLEIDKLVAQVRADAQVHMINPCPNNLWYEKLKSRFGKGRVHIWSDGITADMDDYLKI